LDIQCTAHCIHYAAELSEHAVAGILDNAPTMPADFRVDNDAQMLLKLSVRALFVLAD
jgi:hypothetical protein